MIECEAGTLVVDIVDARTDRLICWAQDSVEGVLGNRDRLGRKIDEGVTRMFEIAASSVAAETLQKGAGHVSVDTSPEPCGRDVDRDGAQRLRDSTGQLVSRARS